VNYLLDTCVISDFFKRIPSVITHFENLSPSQIHISTITVMEIEYGLRLNEEREKKIRPLWDALLKQIKIVIVCHQCAIAIATIRAKLKSAGLLIGPYDILIAGTALANNFTMITSNLKEFNRISEIKIENWRT
jgi:tRNA(fMet)-specific endonuclease VapC